MGWIRDFFSRGPWGWLGGVFERNPNRRWSHDEIRDRSIQANMGRARAEGRPAPGATTMGFRACRRYIPGHTGPTACEWPYCDCTAGKALKADTGAVFVSSSHAPAPRADPLLPCHGCGHSAAQVAFPGAPSGERPCLFCTRNPEQAEQLKRLKANLNPGVVYTARYDNGPTRQEVGDQYIATDRLTRDVPAGNVIVT